MTSTDKPLVCHVRQHKGTAGQFSVTARVEYPGEEARDVEFVGSTYGGPVVMRSGPVETFVTDPGRFGEFGTPWVHRFFDAA